MRIAVLFLRIAIGAILGTAIGYCYSRGYLWLFKAHPNERTIEVFQDCGLCTGFLVGAVGLPLLIDLHKSRRPKA